MTYNEENTKLLKTILNSSFFKPWKDKSKYSDYIEKRDIAVELYVTPVCNQKCEYCYLYKYGDSLYPKDIRDKDTILKNLDTLIEYFIREKLNIHRIDVFSGEILHTDFGIEVLNRLYNGKINGLLVEEIHYPTNCSFLLDDKAAERVQAMFDKLKEAGLPVYPSASVDGLIVEEEARPFIDSSYTGRRDQNFYDKVFEFIIKNNGGFHPMVSAHSIEKWVDNFDWWVQQCDKYNISLPHSVMMLEVRNDEWTPDKIKTYTEFLKHYGEWLFNVYCAKDRALFTRLLIGLECDQKICGYINLHLSDDTQIATCSVSQQLTIRLGDLAICPCHRTSYPEYLYGKFVVEDGRIVDIEGNNPFVAAKILMMNQRVCHHGCDVCWNKNFCIRQCFGAQLESGQEIFMPIESVCNLLKEKTATLYKIYCEYGVREQAEHFVKHEYILSSQDRNRLLVFLTLFNQLEASLLSYTELRKDDSEG